MHTCLIKYKLIFSFHPFFFQQQKKDIRLIVSKRIIIRFIRFEKDQFFDKKNEKNIDLLFSKRKMASTQIDDGAQAKMSDFVEELYTTAAKMIEEHNDFTDVL
jgi:hypothetical protein